MRWFSSFLVVGLLSSACSEGVVSVNQTPPPPAAPGGDIETPAAAGGQGTAGGNSGAAGGAAGGTVSGAAGGAAGGMMTSTGPDFPLDGFCGQATTTAWAFCEDFDGLGMGAQTPYPAPTNLKLEFHAHSHNTVSGVSCETSVDCSPYLLNGAAHINSEDSSFGMSVQRIKQPFDFANRTGHLRFTSVLKGHGRMQLAIHLSPQPTNNMPDLRDPSVGAMDRSPALTLTYAGEGGWPFAVLTWNGGNNVVLDHANGPLGINLSGLHEFEIAITRTTLKLKLDGVERMSTTFPDLGFDKAYVHLTQVSYNPAKDGYIGDTANRFEWDNIAFDGPALAVNALTPAGQQDVLFRAFSTTGCRVRGVTADGPHNMLWGLWHTWHVRLPDTNPVAASDITCDPAVDSPYRAGPHIQEIHSITR